MRTLFIALSLYIYILNILIIGVLENETKQRTKRTFKFSS